jgi:hypothetical protein
MSARWRCATIAMGLLGPWVLPAPVIAAPGRALLGTVASTVETAAFVSALDPASLRPVGPRVELGEYHDGWSFSPDGRLIAFGKSPAGRNTRDGIRIVDTAQVALVGTVLTPAYVGPLAWLAPRRLVGLVADQRPVVVDPLVPRIVGPRAPREAGTCGFPSAATGRRLVVLAPRAVVTVDARGGTRRVEVPRVPSRCARAALVVDARREVAWVLTGRRGVVRVDLRAMRAAAVSVHGAGPAGRTSVEAVALGGRRIAASHATTHGAGRGVEVVDLRQRRRRIVDPRAGAVAVGRSTVLAYDGGVPRQPHPARIGVRGYRGDGRRRFAVLRGRHVWNVQVAGSRAYAFAAGGVSTIDLRTGRISRTAPAITDADVEVLHPPPRR